MLLIAGANPNLQDKRGYSAMMSASEFGYFNVVSILIEYNGDVNLKQEDGTTALILGT
jgi:ankyrin repeat protein